MKRGEKGLHYALPKEEGLDIDTPSRCPNMARVSRTGKHAFLQYDASHTVSIPLPRTSYRTNLESESTRPQFQSLMQVRSKSS